MARRAAEVVLRAIQTEAAGWRSSVCDRDLLRRFAGANDQGAFAALFHRHGGMVLGVCRRALPNLQEAEDACQATFLVLARKAKGGRWQASVANWLYATARKVAANARVAARRRARREGGTAVAEALHPLDQMTSRELLAALDQELDQLSPRYREPLVLCYLEGLTRDEAARRLGVPLGTLKIRLERGRKRLGNALTGRGCALGAGLLALAVVSPAGALPPRLVAAVVTAASGSPSPVVAALAREVAVSGMMKKASLAVLATFGALALGMAWAASMARSPQPANEPPVQKAPSSDGPASQVLPVRADVLGDPLPPWALARLGTTRFRAGMWSRHLTPTPDGRKLLTVDWNNSLADYLTVWDLDTGRRLRQVLLPDGGVQAVHVGPDGRGFALVHVSRDDYAVWEFTDEKAPPPTVDGSRAINSVGPIAASAVSPNGSLVAAGERGGDKRDKGKLNVWNLVPNGRLRSAQPRWTMDTPGRFLGLAFTPDGTRLIGFTQRQEPDGAGPNTVVRPGDVAPVVDAFVWDAATGKEVLKFEMPGGKEMYTRDAGETFKGETFKHETPAGLQRTIAVAPDGRTVYALSQGGRVTVIDLATGKERFGFVAFSQPPRGFNDGLAVTADGQIVIAAQPFARIAGFDARTGKELWQSQLRMEQAVNGLTVLPDGKRFVLSTHNGEILLCDAATGKVPDQHRGHGSPVSAVAIADGGRTAVTAGGDQTLRRWDLSSGKEVSRTAVEGFAGTAFAPDLRTVFAMGQLDGKWVCGVIDAATGKRTAWQPLEDRQLSRPTWLPDGSLILSGGTDKATRFDRTGRELHTFKVAGRVVDAVAISPEGKTLVLAGGNPRISTFEAAPGGWVGVFDLLSGERKGLWEYSSPFLSAAYTPDGAAVVLTARVSEPPRSVNELPVKVDLSGAMVLFDPAHGKVNTPFAVPPGPYVPGRSAHALAVAPTGYQLAVAELFQSEPTIMVYEAASGTIRRQLRGHTREIKQMAFTPDGLKLVSVSTDMSGLVWDVAPPSPATPATLSEADRRTRWDTLGSSDGQAAYRAMGELIAGPAGTVAFLRANLKPTLAPTDAAVDRLVERLDAPAFPDRETASRELDNLGRLAMPRVRDRLPLVSAPEVRRRLETFLQEHDRPGRLTGARLRERRAVELLEAIGTSDAVEVLNTTAESANTPLARDAAAAAKRLRAR